MHAQVMSNNNGTGAQVNDLVATKEENKKLVEMVKSLRQENTKKLVQLLEMKEDNEKLVNQLEVKLAKSIKEKNKKLVEMEMVKSFYKEKYFQSIKEKNEMEDVEEENKRLKVTHKEQVLKLK